MNSLQRKSLTQRLNDKNKLGSIIGSLRRRLKLISAFLIVNFLTSLFAPNIAYALTAGPTSPDYTSFEPVDTTDMVNLLSGDLAYNIPLLEVPGPAGGYPLSMSYHAGIMPNEEASWAGLGWTINPGAINRTVNGYADDFKDVEHTDRFYWSGGSTTVATVGVTLGIAGVAGVGAGISIGTDTYQGFGVGSFVSANFGVGGEKSPLGVGFNFGVDPWGNPSAGAGVGISTGGQGSAVNLSANLGVSTNFQSISASGSGGASVSYGAPSGKSVYLSRGSASLVGGSISVSGNGIKPSTTISVGGTRISNSKQGNISTSGYSITLPLPFLNLGFSYQRYWIDETEKVQVNGVLNFPKGATPGTPGEITHEQLDANDYDVYSIQDASANYNSEEYNNPDKARGGTLPNFDHYNVVAQGVTGSMRPFIYQQNLVKRNYIDGAGDDQIVQYPHGNYNPQSTNVGFRFINDFSNKFVTDNVNPPSPGGSTAVNHNFSPNPQTGEDGSSDFNDGVLSKASRRVYHYKNSDILAAQNQYNTTGVWPSSMLFFKSNGASGFDRSDAPSEQIGGFTITNETGVTYHFTLPAYSYDEYSYSENHTSQALTFNEYKNPEKYAYTWHLTGITGPDYVDRGGGANGNDANGMIDEGDWGYWIEFDYGKWTDQYFWRTPGKGMDEDLDADFQNLSDGTKEVYYLDAIRTKTHTAYFVKDVREDGLSSLKYFRNLYSHHFDPFVTNIDVPLTNQNKQGGFTARTLNSYAQVHYPGILGGHDRISNLIYSAEPTKSLRLDKVILVDNDMVGSINKSSGTWNEFTPYTATWSDTFSDLDPSLHLQPYVFDQHKPNNVIDVRDLNAGIISNAKRIIDLDNDHYDLVKNTPNSSDGKLTLRGLHFLGKGGQKVIPGMEFSYLKEHFLYGEEKYDIWGMYKPDYVDTGNERNDRQVTTASAADVDAWSLSSISTSLGSTIDLVYESDDYRRSSMILNYSVHTYNNQVLSTSKARITPDNSTLNIQQAFKLGEMEGLFDIEIEEDCYDDYDERYVSTTHYDTRKRIVTVTKVTDSYIEVEFDSPVFLEDPSYSCDEYVGLNFAALYPNGIDQHIGGGLRVSEVNVTDGDVVSTTEYKYVQENGTQSSGVTPYEPFGFDPTESTNRIGRILNEDLSKLINLSSEIPAPGVLYDRVEVREKTSINGQVKELPSYSVYEFETFGEEMVELKETYRDDLNHGQNDPDYNWAGFTVDKFKRVGVQLKNYSTMAGNLKSISVKESANDRLISKTENLYLHDQLTSGQTLEDYEDMVKNRFNDQGVIQEAYLSTRYVRKPNNGAFDMVAVSTLRESYPSIQLGTKTTNYRTGITTETRNLAFDFYSGQVIETYQEDGYGNKIGTRHVPAYRSSAGIATSMAAKNMLTQEGETYTFKLKPDFNPDVYVYDFASGLGGSLKKEAIGLISATYQSWSNGIDIVEGNTIHDTSPAIRKSGYYINTGFLSSSLPDGTQAIVPTSQFEVSSNGYPNPSLGWEKQSQITLYDINSHALEAQDINENYAATRFDSDNERVIATTANARYKEFTYSGFENSEDGNLTISGPPSGNLYTGIVSDFAHTGDESLRIITSGKAEFRIDGTNLTDGRVYRINYWTHQPSSPAILYYSINDGAEVSLSVETSAEKSVTIDGVTWYWVDRRISLPPSFSTVDFGLKYNQGIVYIDDFRLSPVDAPMTSYVYNEWGELSDILDANNLFTHYEYDAMGRLMSVKRETFVDGPKILSENFITYGKKDLTTFYPAISAVRIDNDTYRISITTDPPDLNGLTVNWDIDGVSFSGTSFDYVFPESGAKTLVADVTHSATGLANSAYAIVNFGNCEEYGTFISSYCETENGCYTQTKVNFYADGACGLYSETVQDGSCLLQNNGVVTCD